jgi:DNA-binding MarR family transcriptional regulator
MNRTRCTENHEDIAEALDQAAVLVMRHLTDRAGLSSTAISVLARLSEEGPARLTALAAAEGVSQPSMSQLVQRLEQQGLATRASDPGDGRATLIAVTDPGRALLAVLRHGRRIRLADLLAALPAEDEAALTLAMHVALPIIQRMIRNATQPRTPGQTAASWSPDGGAQPADLRQQVNREAENDD